MLTGLMPGPFPAQGFFHHILTLVVHCYTVRNKRFYATILRYTTLPLYVSIDSVHYLKSENFVLFKITTDKREFHKIYYHLMV